MLRVITSYRGAPRIRGWETGSMIADGFRTLGHNVEEFGTIYQSKQSLGRSLSMDEEFDLLLYCEMNDPEPQYSQLKYLKTKKKVGWFFDNEMISDKYKQLIDYFGFDYIFLANPDTVNYFKNLGYHNIYFLPYAADEKLHYRPLGFEKKYDFILAGSDRPERRKLISDLNSAGINAHLIVGVYREAYIDALASAKVVINDEAGGGKNLRSMRYYESRCAGAVLFTPGLDKDNKDPGVFEYTDTNHLIRLCRAYLNNPYPYNYGQEDVLKYDTYQNRAKTILEVCDLA